MQVDYLQIANKSKANYVFANWRKDNHAIILNYRVNM